MSSMETLLSRISLVLLVLTLASWVNHAWGASTDWRDTITVPDTPNDVLTADLEDVECLALNIYHEARNVDRISREVSIYSVLNRAGLSRHGLYSGDICEVITDIRRDRDTGELVPHYSWTLDGRSDKAFERERYVELYFEAIEYLFTDREPLLANAHLITNYHDHTVDPDWWNLRVIGDTGTFVYYTRRDGLAG